ncbi:DEAD/DEAH box helicase [uncultured Novosphingobium sp.]|uniref:DEAD/DEAH box helicase n=1 Tax=uncultured Novosphingobium sp. TaxID=292277 RepID=UPI00258F0B54|nr:DEAD/DEAH box helicase [uncultured Novosphingobium sp.]
MNVFELDADLVGRYEAFARSFTTIRAGDISRQVDEIYRSGKFWPEPLIGVNPHFASGRSLADLAVEGVVDPDTPKAFAFGPERTPIDLHLHQDQALSKALQNRNYIVTTGTGSGKSLCFFVPIIDRILKAKRAGAAPRTRAIVIYPMNALANSQREELEKFIDSCGIDENLKPTFARYTGQEKHSERQRIAETKPDIILTNFMMLELLMTRQDDLDRQVVANMEGLEFLVLDELHTYRGRQGADVAMLVRRVRERLGAQKMLCIGTSATMASGDEDARVALRRHREALLATGLAWVARTRLFQRWINIVGVIGGGVLTLWGGGMEGSMVPQGDGLLTAKGVLILGGGLMIALASVLLLHLQDEAPALLERASALECEAQGFLDERDAMQAELHARHTQDERRLALIDANRFMREALEQALLTPELEDPAVVVEAMLDAALHFLTRSIGFDSSESWAISVFQVRDDRLVRLAARRADRLGEKADGRCWGRNEGFVGAAWAGKRDVIIADGTAQDIVADYPVPADRQRSYDNERYRSLAAIPVRLGDPPEIWGVVAASTDVAGRFRRDPDNRQVQAVDTVRLIARMTALMAAAFKRSH